MVNADDKTKPKNDEDVTLLLQRMRNGDETAGNQVLAVLYDELRRIARIYLAKERADHTLQPTALVHEAYLRLAGPGIEWVDRTHFLATAAQVMRRILVDMARRRRARKRGGDIDAAEFQAAFAASRLPPEKLLELDDALQRLAVVDARQCTIVEMRYFGGLTIPEVAAALGVADRTVLRDWNLARAWLFGELRSNKPPAGA
jgi:RNA polymerase sigma factor (TIGR02999 family)